MLEERAFGRPLAPFGPLCFRDGVCDEVIQVANGLAQLALSLFFPPLGPLLLASDQLPGFLLDLAAEVFEFAFDLIFVWGDGHDEFLNVGLRATIDIRAESKIHVEPSTAGSIDGDQ